jgi:hypothetical protein
MDEWQEYTEYRAFLRVLCGELLLRFPLELDVKFRFLRFFE